MKKFNLNNPMKFNLWYMAAAICFLTGNASAADEKKLINEGINTEVRQFFDNYLNTYNQRFGQPDKTESFISSISALIHEPFLMSPPASAPFQPQGQNQLTQVFDGFVQNLEKKGAVKLSWQSVNLQVMTANKVLANNIGIATNKKGEVVYETISIYLLVRDEGNWKIALFSPYELERKVIIKS